LDHIRSAQPLDDLLRRLACLLEERSKLTPRSYASGLVRTWDSGGELTSARTASSEPGCRACCTEKAAAKLTSHLC
jgi:hypothetical protein